MSSPGDIFAWGHQGLQNRQRVRVRGIYRHVKRVRQYTFYNEIEAWQIEVLDRKGGRLLEGLPQIRTTQYRYVSPAASVSGVRVRVSDWAL